MKSFEEAYAIVLEQSRDYGIETIPLKQATGRVLAEDIHADRDLPPFDRSTRDGIAIRFDAIENGRMRFEISGVIPAGVPAVSLPEDPYCYEIMTGASMPYEADTVIMYEEIDIDEDIATLKKRPVKGQNIHPRGSDARKGDLLIKANTVINSGVAGVLASVGKAEIAVKKLPRIAMISTGNEIIDIDVIPEAHQVRRSNSYAIASALSAFGIKPMMLHLSDDPDMIRQKLSYAVQEIDVLILSGGVSQGKYDYIPQVLTELGVKTLFHRVLQKPGKPFLFGVDPESKTVIFSFPGNPVSTFLNFFLYFKPWFLRSAGLEIPVIEVTLMEDVTRHKEMTRFIGAQIVRSGSSLMAKIPGDFPSGNLVMPSMVDGFLIIPPGDQAVKKGDSVRIIRTKYQL